MKTIKVKATQNIFDVNGSVKGFGQKLEGEVFDVEEKTDNKATRVDSLKNEIYEATNNLINVLNEQIKEAQKDTSTINSIEKIQSLLRIKLELITELQQSRMLSKWLTGNYVNMHKEKLFTSQFLASNKKR